LISYTFFRKGALILAAAVNYVSPWQEDLPRNARIVYRYLADRAGNKDLTWPAVKTISSGTGYSIRSVQYALRLLEARGYIQTKPRYRQDGKQSSNIYQLHRHGAVIAPPDQIMSDVVNNNIPIQEYSSSYPQEIIKKVHKASGSNIGESFAVEICDKYNRFEIDCVLKDMQRQLSQGVKIWNVGGWLRTALRNSFGEGQPFGRKKDNVFADYLLFGRNKKTSIAEYVRQRQLT
jgi:hypothetical protein